ncbi:MAG: aminopeptidase N [Candidatus Nanopelagicales bacterium]|jgi:aminopeptidase N
MSLNITRAEAAERAGLVRVDSYDVVLDLTGSDRTFGSTTTVTFDCTAPGASTWIDLVSDAVHSVVLNGTALDVAAVVDGSRIALPDLAERNVAVIVADALYMNTGEGLHRFVDPVDKETYLYTQFESADSRRMYAVFEQPDLKAAFGLTVTAPSHWKVVSNSPSPEPAVHGDGTATWRFEPTPRISSYITALVAGPYHRVTDEYVGPNGTYPLGVYCRESLAQYLDADEILTVTKQGFAYFEEKFGVAYPFAKYDQLFVPEFNAGAMENAGCVTLLEDYVFRSRVTDAAYEQRANTILHELAHMWFGDLVTMTWWDDLWLNESFAEWAAHWANANATRYTDAWTTFANLRKAWAYRQDQLPSTHPIAADMVDLDSVRVNFDGITYAKGASALRQLVAWVGEDEFLAGVHNYFGRHAWGNTRLTDLLSELEATSGRDLGPWTHEWLQTSGVNLLRPEISLGAYRTMTEVAIVQEPPAVPAGIAPILRSHRIGVGLYDLTAGGLVLRTRLEVDVVGERTVVPELAGSIQPDLLLLNDGDYTFAKVRLDERSWATAVAHLGTLTDSLARAIIWSAAWDMTRDAEVSTGEFLSLVLEGVGTETDIGVVQGILRQARTAIDQYAAPQNRDAYLARYAEAMHTLALAAEPNSDRQLAFTRAFIGSATSPADLATVGGLLDGTLVWEGLTVDADLRWSLLHALVAAGARDEDAIEAEVDRDDTATGRRHAASARAARPTAVAKELAWAEIVDRTDLPNAILSATMGGFVQPGQTDLLVPYRDRYFAELPRIWADRTMEMAQDITTFLYPFLLVDDETIAASDAFLAGPANDLPGPARRLVEEGRDGVLRAARARAKDAEV